MRAVVEHKHVPVVQFAEQTVDSFEVPDDVGEGFSARGGPGLDEVSVNDESELERVHERMVGVLTGPTEPAALDIRTPRDRGLDRAAVLIVRLARNHPLPEGNKQGSTQGSRVDRAVYGDSFIVCFSATTAVGQVLATTGDIQISGVMPILALTGVLVIG